MSRRAYPDEVLRRLFAEVETIAVVGASPRGERRASWRVMRFLQQHGYRAYPVNPEALGRKIHGEQVYASVSDVPGRIDMVDIFRRSSKAAAAVEEAIARGVPYIWMQLGVVDEAAAARAEDSGATVIMDRCPAIELPRLRAAA